MTPKPTNELVESKPPISRRGLQRYDKNPFINLTTTKLGVRRVASTKNDRMMVVNEQTGEIIAPGVTFGTAYEVDKTQFVKLYINGVKAFKDLTGAGTKVFELLYLEVQKSFGKDVMYLSFSEIDQLATPISKATFMKGMKELLEKGFIAESMTQGKYFLNPDYIFNGDRLAFIREVRLKGSKYSDPRQQTLPLEDVPAIEETAKRFGDMANHYQAEKAAGTPAHLITPTSGA
jgi:hypothetical protein